MQQLKASFGPWTVNIPKDDGEYSVVDKHGNVIALVNEIGNASIMASAKEMLEELINIHEIVEEETYSYGEKLELIEEAISRAVQKVAAESDV